nr:hypothetical protein [Tanacetum cinerariifolium]
MIDELDRDEGAVLMSEKEEKKAEEVKDITVKVVVPSTRRRRGVVIRDPKEESSAKTPTKTKSKEKGIMVEEPKPMKKKQQVELDEAYARKLHKELNQDIDWEVAIDHVKQKAMENPYVQRLDYFKGMSYDDIRPIFEAKFNSNIDFLLKSKEQIEEEENRAIESINETPAQKVAKRRRLNEEAEDVEELKQHLEIMPNEDDDVHTEATPLARKVPVVDYQIIQLNNKPHFKIIRPDGTHQLYTHTLLSIINPIITITLSRPLIVNHVFLFAESHNMVTILEKSDAAEGFEQIIDFLSGSYINHALTVNPHVYISCIKQFWNTVVVKRSGDVTRLQALVDKKRIVITEEVVHEILQLNDAEGIICLPNEEIFAGLARMGYEKPSKFYMYPWFIQLIIQNNIANLSTHTTRYISPALTHKVFANMRRVRKGFSRVETPLFESILVVRDVAEEAEAQVPAQGDDVQEPAAEEVVTEVVPPIPTSPSPPSPVIPCSPPHQPPCPPQPQDTEVPSLLFQQVLDTCSALACRVEGLENDKAAQQLEIVKLKARGRIIAYMEQDEGIELVADQEKDAEVEGRHADKQAELYNLDLDHSSKVLSMQEDDTEAVAASTPIPAAKPKIPNIAAAPAVSTRKRKRVVIRDPEEELPSDTPAETPKVKDKGKGILIEAPKPMKKKDQIELDAEYERKLQEEVNKEHEETYKNIDWNAALDHVQS